MRYLKLYENFERKLESNEEDMEVSENPDFENKTTAVLNLSSTKDDTIVKSINQSQFNTSGAIRYKDIDGIEKPGGDGKNNPFFKAPNEEYPIKDVPNGLVIVYMGSSYRVVSKS